MIDVIGTDIDLLGECPIFDERVRALYSIDIDGRAVRRFTPDTDEVETHSLDGRPGSIALTSDPAQLLVATEGDLCIMEWASGDMSPWMSLAPVGPQHRLNDGALDRSGRFWVGTMHEAVTESTGHLFRIDVDGASTVIDEGQGVPNGLAFSPDGGAMYYADSVAKTVWVYDYDDATGDRTRQRILTDFSNLPGAPDGGTVDEDGCYWIACVFGSAIARLTPTGTVDRIIEVPVDKPTKPAFGGPGLGTMYVTSIGGGGTHARHADPGVNGRLLALDVGVNGVAEPHLALPTTG
ncbi:MAG: SMP-30/gluconolactonase/LRE family protein [Acidimicrobiia bacterium]